MIGVKLISKKAYWNHVPSDMMHLEGYYVMAVKYSLKMRKPISNHEKTLGKAPLRAILQKYLANILWRFQGLAKQKTIEELPPVDEGKVWNPQLFLHGWL